ncbi:hypothetical protein L873DRAFT_94056 [Choiromyces venosus 120613-1]|uniref:Uncharacterized protein n=1 Tax=Choiromyces venosus 120613-1 TaxID=1336337 RepID=A0A3N4JZE4_9PEZI|nr:hypothetical protein L873DRAFT_94056 [Choiromyces venosus 120613-1]
MEDLRCTDSVQTLRTFEIGQWSMPWNLIGGESKNPVTFNVNESHIEDGCYQAWALDVTVLLYFLVEVSDVCTFKELMVEGLFLGTLAYRQSPRPPGQMLIGGFCMRKRAVTSAIATVHLSKPLGSFLFGFSCPGEGGVRVAWEAV